MNFSDKLAKQRKTNNLSQEQLAEKLGVTRQSVSKWESGESYPDMAKIIQLCKILNCKLNDIMEDGLLADDTTTSENNVNIIKKSLDSFLSLVTRVYNMLVHMTWRAKLGLLVEMAAIILLLSGLSILVSEGIEMFLRRIFNLFPAVNVVYAIRALLMTIVDGALVLLAIVVISHLFKIRYLDYYVTLTDDNVSEQTLEEPIAENVSALKGHDAMRVIIRDPKHSSSVFFDGFLNCVVFVLRFMLLLVGIPLLIGVLLAVAVMFFCLFRRAWFFKFVAVAVLGVLLFGGLLLLVIFNVLFNHRQQYSWLLGLFFASIIICGFGSGLAVNEFTKMAVIDQRYLTDMKSEQVVIKDLGLTDSVMLACEQVEYVVDEQQDDVVLEFTYPERCGHLYTDCFSLDDGEIERYYSLLTDDYFIFSQLIEDLDAGFIRPSYENAEFLRVRVICNSENRLKIRDMDYRG